MDWKVFVSELTANATLVAVVALLGRSIIASWLSKDIERYKAELSAENERAIEHYKAELSAANEQTLERLRNDLKIQSLEHEVRFRKLHERQAEAIAESHELLYDLFQRVRDYVHWLDRGDEPDKDGKLQLVIDASTRFEKAFYPRGILYFPRPVADRIDNLTKQLVKITNEFSAGRLNERSGKDTLNHWTKGLRELEDAARPLLREIQSEFQGLLGVSSVHSC